MRKIGFVRDCCFELVAAFMRRAYLVAPIFPPPFPPTRFILEPLVGGTEKSLFFCVLFRKRKSDFSVLIADAVRLEPVEWHHPVLGLLPLGMRANLRGSTYSPGVRALACPAQGIS